MFYIYLQSAHWKEEHSKMCCQFFYKCESEREWLASKLPADLPLTSALYVSVSRASKKCTVYYAK